MRRSTRTTLLLAAAAIVAACGPGARATPPAASTAPPAPSPTTGASATPTASPSPSAPPSTSPSSGPAAYCAVADELTAERDYDHPERTVLDPTHALPPDYVPPDLVGAVDGRPAASGERIQSIAYADLAALRDAAAAAGRPLAIVSAYRSYAEQQETFDHWVSVGGYEQALRTSARAGHSEHQLGAAVDLGDGSRPPWEYSDWGATSAGAWLAANATAFGFVMSYPQGKTDVTCYEYEPWHFRWVGRELAARVAASGLTLHEFQTATR